MNIDNRTLLYAAQEVAYPGREWEIRPYIDIDGSAGREVVCLKDVVNWSPYNLFDPINDHEDWLNLREGLETRKHVLLFPCGDVYKAMILPGATNTKTLCPTYYRISSLENKSPRALALDACRVLRGS